MIASDIKTYESLNEPLLTRIKPYVKKFYYYYQPKPKCLINEINVLANFKALTSVFSRAFEYLSRVLTVKFAVL